MNINTVFNKLEYILQSDLEQQSSFPLYKMHFYPVFKRFIYKLSYKTVLFFRSSQIVNSNFNKVHTGAHRVQTLEIEDRSVDLARNNLQDSKPHWPISRVRACKGRTAGTTRSIEIALTSRDASQCIFDGTGARRLLRFD